MKRSITSLLGAAQDPDELFYGFLKCFNEEKLQIEECFSDIALAVLISWVSHTRIRNKNASSHHCSSSSSGSINTKDWNNLILLSSGKTLSRRRNWPTKSLKNVKWSSPKHHDDHIEGMPIMTNICP